MFRRGAPERVRGWELAPLGPPDGQGRALLRGPGAPGRGQRRAARQHRRPALFIQGRGGVKNPFYSVSLYPVSTPSHEV